MTTIVRYLLMAVGVVFLALALVGAVLPVMPTVPFLLVSAACFMRSSKRMHEWMLAHPLFGDDLGHYQAGRGVPARTKLLALVTVWTSIPVSTTLLYIRFGPVAHWFAAAAVMFSAALFATWFLLVRVPVRPVRPVDPPGRIKAAAYEEDA